MLPFTQPHKLYLFKDRDHVNLSLKISDDCVIGYNFTSVEFEQVLAAWDGPDGIELKTHNAHFSIAHKHFTPRPERAHASYVRWSVFINGMSFHHRLAFADMEGMRKDYFYQKNNRMHWDKD